MAIIDHSDWGLSEKGRKDADRHRQKIDKVIRENVRDAIADSSIITRKDGKTVRIPVKGLRDYRFVYGGGTGGGGAGQGPAKPDDIISQRPRKRNDKGPPGSDPGIDYMETEVDIDYLLEIMFEDLGLPWIEEKTKAQQLIPKGWKFDSITKSGTQARIHKLRSLKEALQRTEVYVQEIMEETGCNRNKALIALEQAEGDLDIAINLIKTNTVTEEIPSGAIFIEDEDLRFKQIEEDIEIHSNAVVFAMMDISYSMTQDKKYLARSMLFWLTEFLKKKYEYVEIVFIVHTTEAQRVNEDHFFHRGDTGGTKCYTAFEMVNYLLETEFPIDEWNAYPVYISDGEDFDPERTMEEVKKMVELDVNMLAYTEIDLDDGDSHSFGYHKVLLKEFQKMFNFEITEEEGTKFYKDAEKRVLACVIGNKTHVYPALKHMLFERDNG